MIYLHILGSGETKAAMANSKGHLFERLMCALCEHLKMEITHINKSENGKEIDLEGKTLVGNVKFFAECKAREDSLNSTDIQKFGYKFLIKHRRDDDVRGLLFTLSPLNPDAQQLWDNDLKAEYGDKVTSYFHDDIVEFLIQHYEFISPDVIRQQAVSKYGRACGDTQLLCIEDDNKDPSLFWAQLLMSSDGTEPNAVVFYGPTGSFITGKATIRRLLSLKHDLATEKLTCLNIKDLPSRLDDISPSRTVVRVRMSSDWFDYRFPAAPQFFVGRTLQLIELTEFIRDVREKKTSSRGMLISGKSGIGKSSLALKARQELQEEKVVFLPIDSRLCDDVGFLFDSVNELLFELRQIPELRDDLKSVRIEGLDSLFKTVTGIHEAIDKHGYLAALFFDQFEKVFEYPEVTKAIRTLFLRVNEKQLAVLFGFAWKSDLWSLAEGFPHHERDDIVRETFALKQLDEFGPEETSEILKQLEVHWGGKLNVQLHAQLVTFSRGLPWLLKKVCAHVLEQKSRGVTENELVETNLKLQDLFEADLAGLDDEERTLLKAIAPLLPTTLRRLSESFEISDIDRSLHRFIDKRILVKITEDIGGSLANVKYDAYSDVFREFLVTGTVPIEDAYYFYTSPRGALKFFEKVRERRELSIEQEMEETGKQIASIYNLSRDLRSLSLVNVHNRVFTIMDEVMYLEQDEILSFLQTQLKRNRLISLTLSELNESETIPLTRIAQLLEELFPPVQAFKEKTRKYYSRTTALWLHYARLALYDKRDKSLHRVDDEAVFESVVEKGTPSLTGFRFPMCFRNAIIECLKAISAAGGKTSFYHLMEKLSKSHQSIEKVLSDNLNLGFVSRDGEAKMYSLTPLGARFVASSDKARRQLFRQQCLNIQVFNQFNSHIEAAGADGIASKQATRNLVQEMQLEMADASIAKLGNMLANWAEYAEIIVRLGRLCFMKEYAPEQMILF
jgi:hypothetical protein